LSTAGLGLAALPYALSAAAIMLGLYYDWFAIADRRAVFLYEHLGAMPFDERTSSRYWIAGLVASAFVLILYNGGVLILARLADTLHRDYHPPAWWTVWLPGAGMVGAGVLLITMTAGDPVLPLTDALTSALASIVGLALALTPATMAARRPAELAWLGADGLAMAPVLLLLRAVELPGSGLSVTTTTAWIVAGGSVVASAIGLSLLTALRAWKRKPTAAALEVLLAGLTVSYLGMPLAHHLLFTPADYRYISLSANFFATSAILQIVVIAVPGLLAAGASTARRQMASRARRAVPVSSQG
jgi:hypothetical protein